jgi:hypothetical protein
MQKVVHFISSQLLSLPAAKQIHYSYVHFLYKYTWYFSSCHSFTCNEIKVEFLMSNVEALHER